MLCIDGIEDRELTTQLNSILTHSDERGEEKIVYKIVIEKAILCSLYTPLNENMDLKPQTLELFVRNIGTVNIKKPSTFCTFNILHVKKMVADGNAN